MGKTYEKVFHTGGHRKERCSNSLAVTDLETKKTQWNTPLTLGSQKSKITQVRVGEDEK